jgi:hypothetical protein
MHGASKTSYIDVIGRIGNLIEEDTEDMRFSNLFKVTTTDGWLIDGIVRTVDQTESNTYLSWKKNDGSAAVDIRGTTADEEHGYYNTYGTQLWTTKAADFALPLSASRNNIGALKTDELKTGYNVLWDISTIGNYYQGALQVTPYFFALDTQTGTLTPVDVYIDDGTNAKAVNYFGLLRNYTDSSGNVTEEYETLSSQLSNYVYSLDWNAEAARRNYTTKEKKITEAVSACIDYAIPVYDEKGNVAMQAVNLVNKETGETVSAEEAMTYNLTIPYGDYAYLGTSQLLYLDTYPSGTGLDGGRARTFIGSSKVTALGTAINGSNDTELLPEECSDVTVLYGVKAQRWHLSTGLPSSATFVGYRGTHVSPNDVITVSGKGTMYARDEFTDSRYVILMTADIMTIGDVYNLKYSQGDDNGVFVVNGKTFKFGSTVKTEAGTMQMPTILAIYGVESSDVDIDMVQTH